MPPGSPRRIQTAKQAKAAFAARGATHVSASERRRLARGAELLERASRLKVQAARRKSAGAKGRDPKADTDGVLGSQRRLDRFGHASSQFHLGKFFAGPKAVETTGGTSHGTAGDDGVTAKEEEEGEPAASPVDAALFPNTIPPTTTARVPLDFSSFGSDDGLFDADTLLRLDRAAEELRARRPASPCRRALAFGKMDAVRGPALNGEDTARRGMLPPPLPVAKKPRRGVGPVVGGLVRGVSIEDLEAVAMAEFVPSQMPSR